MFRAITVSREYGSGGGMIARAVAEKLGWELLDRALIAEVARIVQVDAESVVRYDEHVDSWWHRLYRGGLLSFTLAAGIAPGDAQFCDAETMADFAKQVMIKAAERGGCVIVGRGAQCVLQDYEDVLHVFIYAPWTERVRRVWTRAAPNGDIEELIRATDDERARYIRLYYGCDWKDPHLYHMMLSSELGSEQVASMILEAVNAGVPAW